MKLNRRELVGFGASILGVAAIGMPRRASAQANELTIAYNVNLPSWDPTTGPSAVNPTIQGFYQSVFDQFIAQKPDLSFAPGLLTEWGWNDDNTKVMMTVRDGVTWHDGSPFTAEDIVWSLERAGKEETGNPIQFVWKNVNNFKVDGNKITGDVVAFDPTYFKWMSFLTGYVLPKAYYEKVGAEGFEKAPIGTGPYMVDALRAQCLPAAEGQPQLLGRQARLRKRHHQVRARRGEPRRRDRSPARPRSRSKSPMRSIDRLKAKDGLAGVAATPISDIGMIFFNDVDPMLDKNVRLAARHADRQEADRRPAAARLRHCRSTPWRRREYEAYDASIKVEYNPEKAKRAAGGVRLLARQAGEVHDPDHARLQAQGLRDDPGDRRHVAQGRHRGRRSRSTRSPSTTSCAPPTSWRRPPSTTGAMRSAIPTTSTGFAMFGPSPHSVWDGQDLIDKINPLWAEKDEAKRIDGWKAVDKLHRREGLCASRLLQYVQPIVHVEGVKVDAARIGACCRT